eukprot:gene9987-2306_t
MKEKEYSSILLLLKRYVGSNDSSLVGLNVYCNNGFGGVAATGDGDIMLRFLPSFKAVMYMKMLNLFPKEVEQAELEIITLIIPKDEFSRLKKYPDLFYKLIHITMFE